VLGALDYANSVGALTIAITCNPNSEAGKRSAHALDVDSGPELLAGSTRLKSGTAQKLVLNMISTVTMVRLGKTFGNLMVDLQISNEKLQDRAIRIIEKATGATRAASAAALTDSGHEVKVAILMLLLNIDANSAKDRLSASQNRIRQALTDG
jgi:N-acetylmuramic acid 6-phosphate etherase